MYTLGRSNPRINRRCTRKKEIKFYSEQKMENIIEHRFLGYIVDISAAEAERPSLQCGMELVWYSAVEFLQMWLNRNMFLIN